MKRVHYVGIGGAGLSALARVDLERGNLVSGSDLRANALTAALAASGARVFVGHRAEHVHGADILVLSSAVSADNPEVVEARRLGIPTFKRAEYLGQLLTGRRQICIAGTHGKTTTTAMTALLLQRAGLQPSYIIGGTVGELGGNAHAGVGPHFVIEADEYDGMFLGLKPWVAAITNVELDHVDCYPTLEAVQSAFAQFAGQTVADGLLLVCADDPSALQTLSRVRSGWAGRAEPLVWTYGLGEPANWKAAAISANGLGGSGFDALQEGRLFGRFELAVPGRHNVANALAAVAIGAWVGLDAPGMAGALSQYRGAGRRFEIKGEAAGVVVIDDYGHHPTEIRATLRAARERFLGRRVWAVFQPHTYSRLKAFFNEFAGSFEDAQRVVITDIYAARERDAGDISAASLAERVAGPPARYIARLEDAAAFLLREVQPGDVVITLGAGDGDQVGELLLAGLRQRGEGDGA